MGASYEQSVRFDAPADDIREAFTDALEDMRAIEIKWSRKRNRLTARTRRNWWCWREVVEIDIRDSGKVVILSRCWIKTQVADYGKNKQNVEALIEAASEALGDRTGRVRRAAKPEVGRAVARLGSSPEQQLSTSGKAILVTMAVVWFVTFMCLDVAGVGPAVQLGQQTGYRRLAFVLFTGTATFGLGLLPAILWDYLTKQGAFAPRDDEDDEPDE